MSKDEYLDELNELVYEHSLEGRRNKELIKAKEKKPNRKEEIKKKKELEEKLKQDFKKGYSQIKNIAKHDGPIYSEGDIDKLELANLFELSSREIGSYSSVANHLMKRGIKFGDIKSAINGARIYHQIGRRSSDFINRRLLDSVKKAYINSESKGKGYKSLPSAAQIEEIRYILKYDTIKRDIFGNRLESKVLPGIFGAITIAGILFGANGFTGAVVGITEKSSLTLGVGLFLAGILGLFISRGKL